MKIETHYDRWYSIICQGALEFLVPETVCGRLFDGRKSWESGDNIEEEEWRSIRREAEKHTGRARVLEITAKRGWCARHDDRRYPGRGEWFGPWKTEAMAVEDVMTFVASARRLKKPKRET